MKKTKDLIIIALIYLLAFAAGAGGSFWIKHLILKYFVFDVIATIVTFIFSTILVNSSVYDAYWSLTPMVMSVALFIELRGFFLPAIVFLVLFNLWGLRLTLNWVSVFTDFSYEDWRYRKFRDETNRFLWPIVNFWGIHMIPTLVVFAGMLPLFEIGQGKVGLLSIPGFVIMVTGVLLEHFADTQMHDFLESPVKGAVCRNGLWKLSRHPNYLGEISFWWGVFLAMIPYSTDHWYYIVGPVSVLFLFEVISIPLMEKRQLKRRPEYAQYKKETSRLLPIPKRKQQ